jgi:hypothetical protein
MNKYRVTFRTFSEYVPCGDGFTTNVHAVFECDVVADDGLGAIRAAANAIGDPALRGGDWKVRMTSSGGEFPEAVGSQVSKSTLVCVTGMGT